MAKYVKFVSSYNPIIFIVDELDRCNPTYAVKTLERIKHLFNIPGIVFVLSIDKSQLCNSIRCYFGSEQLNAEEYLQRFIDFEYHLPFPSVKDYCNYLYGLYGFGEFFKSEKRLRNRNIKHETSDFLTMSELLFHNMNFNLRQIEKQFIHLRIALLSFSEISYVHPGVVVLLEYFRHKHIDFYNKLHHKEYTIDELVAKLEEILPHNIISQPEDSQDFHFFVWEVAKLICCYVQDNVHFRRTYKLISDGDEPDLCFETKRFNRKELLSMIRHNAGNELSYGIVDIRILIDHIELIYDLAVN